MILSIGRRPTNNSRCVFGSCDETSGLSTMADSMRYQILKQHRVFIPKQARTCDHHKLLDVWDETDIYDHNTNQFTRNHIEELIALVLNDDKVVPNEPAIENADIKKTIGLTNVQFDLLYSMIPSLKQRYKGKEKSAKSALKAYLMRLRTGHTYEQIAQTFGISTVTLRKMLTAAREALLNDAVANHFGIQNITREQLVNNTTTMAKTMFCGGDQQKSITIWDGTYIFCNKSFNQHLQRSTYSGQKLRNLVKPMVCVTTNGYFVDVFGPYVGKKNDAWIMNHILENNREPITAKLHPGDIFLLDRGFRDCENELVSMGYEVKMPDFILKADKSSQLTTEKANRSRLVTANRFAIESRNGNMKTIWKIFDSRWSAYDQRHLMDDFRIGAMLINFFYNTIEPNKDDAPEIAAKMLESVDTTNDLAKIVFSNQFQRQIKDFQAGNENTVEFPELQKAELKKISLGNYQIKQMNPYTVEHLRSSENQFRFYVCPDSTLTLLGNLISTKQITAPILVLVVLRSRFQASKHQTFVLADKSKNGSEGIIAYCCDCKHGNRTVGCCSHVMCLTGYLGYLRHHPHEIKEASSFLNTEFIQ